MKAKQHVWYNFGTNTDYVKTGSVSWNDGKILVTPEEEPEPTTEPQTNISPEMPNRKRQNRHSGCNYCQSGVLGRKIFPIADESAAPISTAMVFRMLQIALMIMKNIVGLVTDFIKKKSALCDFYSRDFFD